MSRSTPSGLRLTVFLALMAAALGPAGASPVPADTLIACPPAGAAGSGPSVVFLIDNSGSMGTDAYQDGNDPTCERFRIPVALIDSLRSRWPSAEVGLAIFTRRLAFDSRDNPFFRPLFPGDTTQYDAYVPLTRLDTMLGTKTGAETLKDYLAFTGNGNLLHQTRRPATRLNSPLPGTGHNGYSPENIRDGTDITLAFDAGKAAMADAKAPRDHRFIVFLSDGEAANVDDIRRARMMEYVRGKDVPTTFTLFFRRSGIPVPPDSIVAMMQNIKANGYSAANPKSQYWSSSHPVSVLVSFFQSYLVGCQAASLFKAPKPGRSHTPGNEAVLGYPTPIRVDFRGRWIPSHSRFWNLPTLEIPGN